MELLGRFTWIQILALRIQFIRDLVVRWRETKRSEQVHVKVLVRFFQANVVCE